MNWKLQKRFGYEYEILNSFLCVLLKWIVNEKCCFQWFLNDTDEINNLLLCVVNYQNAKPITSSTRIKFNSCGNLCKSGNISKLDGPILTACFDIAFVSSVASSSKLRAFACCPKKNSQTFPFISSSEKSIINKKNSDNPFRPRELKIVMIRNEWIYTIVRFASLAKNFFTKFVVISGFAGFFQILQS